MNRRDFLLCVALVLLTAVAYWPAMHCGFIWDDDVYVTRNQTLLNLEGLRQIWFKIGAVPQFYPLVHTTFWVEYHSWGLNPFGYHLVNVLLHGLAAILLWRVLTQLKVPGAWLAAGIFALHPVHVESVAWITERKNVLSAVLYLAAALTYLRFVEWKDERIPGRRGWYYYCGSLVLFVAALLSKTVTCSLPAALLIVRWWKKGRLSWSDVRPLLPFFVFGVAMGLLTAWMEKFHVGAKGEEWSLTILERCLVAGRALWFYAGKLIWPAQLTFIYPRWVLDTGVWWQWLFPVAAGVVVVALWLARRRVSRGPLTAVLFFAGTLAPALGFVNVYPFRYSFVADHFQYLASIGLIALAACGIVSALNSFGNSGSCQLPLQLKRMWLLQPALCGALLLTLGTLTWRQTFSYADSETLWRATLVENPGSWMAHNNLGSVLNEKGRRAEAMAECREALRINPNSSEALVSLGGLELQNGETEAAVEKFRAALRINPKNYIALTNIGVVFADKKQFDQAIEFYQAALQANPDYAGASYNLGNALLAQGKIDQAVASYKAALRVLPNYPRALYNLGNIFVSQHKFDEAISYYTEALRFKPEYPEAHYQLGRVLVQVGRRQEAVVHLSEALRLKPDYPDAKQQLRALGVEGPD